MSINIGKRKVQTSAAKTNAKKRKKKFCRVCGKDKIVLQNYRVVFLTNSFFRILILPKKIKKRMEEIQMAFYPGMCISTPEEVRKGYEQTEQEDVREYRLKTLDEFVKSWKVKYFFNYRFKSDFAELYKALPGLSNLVDHTRGFVDEDGNYFLLLQPYANPEEFCRKNHVRKYVRYWLGGFHHEKAYAVVISGDFLTYVEKEKGWDYKKVPESITKISDVHRKRR